MQRLLLFVLAALLAAPALSLAQSSDEELVARATMAAPQRVRGGAGVVRWDDNNNRIVVKESENGLVCWDRSEVPGTAPFAVQCSAEANLPRFEQNRMFSYQAADADERRALMAASEEDGTRALAAFGSVWYSMNGADQENANRHATIAVPNATADSVGLPVARRSDGLWLMQAGTSSAHLMVPGF